MDYKWNSVIFGMWVGPLQRDVVYSYGRGRLCFCFQCRLLFLCLDRYCPPPPSAYCISCVLLPSAPAYKLLGLVPVGYGAALRLLLCLSAVILSQISFLFNEVHLCLSFRLSFSKLLNKSLVFILLIQLFTCFSPPAPTFSGVVTTS